MDRYRITTWTLAAALLLAAAVNYVPALKDADGRVLGLFNLNAYQDGLHIVSAAWAATSAAISSRAALLFLRTFGPIYLLDGIVGVATGSSFLDLSLFIEGVRSTPPWATGGSEQMATEPVE